VSDALIDYWNGVDDKPVWTIDRTPYSIFIVELLLMRTQMETVKKVYPIFMERFPSLTDLQCATELEIEDIIAKLGFRKRARILRDFANDHDSIPNTLESLKDVNGIGKYVSAAIMCFGFDERFTLIDTNVVRFFTRYFGADKSEIEDYAEILLPINDYVEYNYGLIYFGIKVCTPKNPKCDECMFSKSCKNKIKKE
jgi:A/G-specific adenine glycosylase